MASVTGEKHRGRRREIRLLRKAKERGGAGSIGDHGIARSSTFYGKNTPRTNGQTGCRPAGRRSRGQAAEPAPRRPSSLHHQPASCPRRLPNSASVHQCASGHHGLPHFNLPNGRRRHAPCQKLVIVSDLLSQDRLIDSVQLRTVPLPSVSVARIDSHDLESSLGQLGRPSFAPLFPADLPGLPGHLP